MQCRPEGVLMRAVLSHSPPLNEATMPFERIVGIDWSGAGTSITTNRGLAVAQATDGPADIVQWHRRSLSRSELVDWLTERLRPEEGKAGVSVCSPVTAGTGLTPFRPLSRRSSGFRSRA